MHIGTRQHYQTLISNSIYELHYLRGDYYKPSWFQPSWLIGSVIRFRAWQACSLLLVNQATAPYQSAARLLLI